MSELTDALCHFADELDAGRLLKATMAVVIVADDEGHCSAVYLGKMQPTREVGMRLCNMGMERFLNGMSPNGSPVATRGSTH